MSAATRPFAELTDTGKWAAVRDGDGRCDGIFWFAVTSTGIFCRPSCKARKPLQKHVRFFQSPEAAQAAGFRACKKCRPEQAAFTPGKDVVQQAKAVYAEAFADAEKLRRLLAALPVGANQLMRLFKEHEGITQSRLLAGLRVAEAQRLLATTSLPILQIALQSGFASTSSFYKHFAELTGTTPAEFRRSQGEKP